MQLIPEQRIIAATFFNPTTQSNIPIINRRTAVTNVIVRDEDTVVLGGLREISSFDSKTQIPWIGEAPIIGWFFKSDSKRQQKNDLMLFVTPHIVKSPVLTPAENYKFTRVDAHWDLPDFFFDDTVEARESRHRFELDQNARDYYPQTMKLPPPVEVTTDLMNTTTEVTSETLTTESIGGAAEK
jgi:type II secretory pathway component GspD/PulD (secretin)